MKGDFSRQTFDAKNHYSGVRMQQGRVQLDADWNEQVDLTAYREETTTGDLVGPCGGPLHRAAFHIVAAASGLTAEEALLPENLNPPTVPAGDFLISGGHYYVDGILCENELIVLYKSQPHLPHPAALAPGRLYLAYLDVWQRHLTALDAPHLREVALGGPDTATRTQVIWQVKLLDVGAVTDTLNCLSTISAWNTLLAASAARLSAQAPTPAGDSDPCLVPPGAGFRGLENQLYRVEIHREGDLGTATFKWSRDNGSVVTRLEGLNTAGTEITVRDLGPDTVLGFAAGQWVEVVDDRQELHGKPGQLVQITGTVDQARRVLPVAPPVVRSTGPTDLNGVDLTRLVKVRRWDQSGTGAVSQGVTTAAGWLNLENGVQVQFSGGAFKTGDYWLIPARTATADAQSGTIEWPQDALSQPLALPPRGIRHHYCRLALLALTGPSVTVRSDCRALFPPGTELTSLFYVSGDGQEGTPDPLNPAALVPLPRPLVVGVANGRWPIVGARVRFTIKAGSGRVQGNASSVDVLTQDTPNRGLAICNWQLDPTTPSQQVEATLLDAAGQPVHLPVRFNASLTSDDREPGIRIMAVTLREPNQPLPNDSNVNVADFLGGLRVQCDRGVHGPSVKPPTCYVTLHLPTAFNGLAPFIGAPVVGYQPLILKANAQVEGDAIIIWQPPPPVTALQALLLQILDRADERLLARFTLKGNFIWGPGQAPELYLDGDVFGIPRGNTTDVRLPSGDGRRGGDFEMWFWLTAGGPPPGPFVIAHTPAGTVSGPVGSVRVTFDRSMNPSTFGGNDVVSFVGPSGEPIAVTGVNVVSTSNNTQFDILFLPQQRPGNYAMVIGPNISDQQGNLMDQNRNGILGEVPGDRYTATFVIQG